MPGIRTKIVIAGHALRADHARLREPAQPHGLTGGYMVHVSANGSDLTEDFVAGDKRKLCYLPIVSEHAQIAVANPAMAYINIHLFISQFAGLIFERPAFFPGFINCICFYNHKDSPS